MQDMIFEITAFLTTAFAFGYGAAKLFKKRKPLYMQILVCAAGCLAIQQMSFMVNLWCGIQQNVSIGLFGIFGCNLFLLSANYGTLDKIVDDGTMSKKSRVPVLIAPLIMGMLTIGTFWVWKPYDPFFAAVSVVVMLPSLPASYFNLKHIVLPEDPFGFLRITKPCNIVALIFYFMTAAILTVSVLNNLMLDGILSALMSATMLALVIFAVKGTEKWGI